MAAPSWSLSGIPAHARTAKDSKDGGRHRAGCPCCAGKAKAKDSPFAEAARNAGQQAAPAPTNVPAAVPIKRTITIFPVSLGSSTRNPYPEIAKAAAVWRPCGVDIKSTIGKCLTSKVLDKNDPKDVLNEHKDPSKPTDEEVEMAGLQPGGSSMLHAYYVPSLSDSNRGESLIKAFTPTLPDLVVVSDRDGASDTLAHEIGHVLLGAGHHGDPDNVMAGGDRNVGVDKVTDEQCAKI
jgi:hypothetical protein